MPIKKPTVFKAVANDKRLKILFIIERNKIIGIQKIQDELEIEQSELSHHLQELRRVGLVHSWASGYGIKYAILDNKLWNLIKQIFYHKNKTRK